MTNLPNSILSAKWEFGKAFVKMMEEKETQRFFTSCISEGLMPKGLQDKFNLARNVNDKHFVQTLQNDLNSNSSKRLEKMLNQTDTNLDLFEADLDEIGRFEAMKVILSAKSSSYDPFQQIGIIEIRKKKCK